MQQASQNAVYPLSSEPGTCKTVKALALRQKSPTRFDLPPMKMKKRRPKAGKPQEDGIVAAGESEIVYVYMERK